MTIQQEAYSLIDQMPDDSVHLIVELIRRMNSTRSKTDTAMDDTVVSAYISNTHRINEIEKLEQNWNGNGAEPFSQKLIKCVRSIVENAVYQPEIFPTANDSIQLEYDKKNGEHMEIEVFEAKDAEVFYIDVNKNEHEEKISSDTLIINERVRKFYE